MRFDQLLYLRRKGSASDESPRRLSRVGVCLSVLLLCFAGLVALSSSAQAQELEVSGRVTEAETDEPLPGVNVIVQETTIGTTTNPDGVYSLEVPSDTSTLVFSFVGYETQEIPVEGRTTINVEMASASQALDEVVVVGYGTRSQAEVTGSVSSVSSADLENDASTTIDQALQGRVAGAQVVRNSGRPGGDVSIQIRGLGTLNTGSSEPLYVVDGVPVSGESESGITNPLATLNPQDIESVDILKDASAAAIYGSRASNGVVLITTKRGEAGQQRVNYSSSVGLNQMPKKLDVLNLRQYAQFVTRRAEIVGYNNQPELVNSGPFGEGSDWQEALFRNAMSTDHSLSVSGGTESTQYRLSGGYSYEQGIAIESNFERYSLRLNLDNQTTNWMEVGTSLSLSRTHEDISVSEDDLITTAIRQRPNVPVRTPGGGYGGPSQSDFQLNNPVGLAELNTNELMRTQGVGEVFANIDLMDNLTLNNELNGTVSFDNQYIFNPTWEFGARTNDQAESSRSSGHSTYWQIRNYLEYNTSFGALNLDAMGGHEVQLTTWDGLSGRRTEFPSNQVQELAAGNAESATNSSYAGSSSMESLFGRLNLSYDNRYLLTGNLRGDASSNFSPENRWGIFPSVSAAWRVTNEPFLEGSSILEVFDQFKLRGGYGYIGNQDIGGYRYGDTYAVIPTDFGSSVRAANLGNPGIQWESTESINLGVDISVFDQRVSLTVDAYQRNVQDLLLNVPLPLYAGTSGVGAINNPLDNIGSMENRGLEFSLNTVNLETEDFRWNTDLVFSMNRNQVTALNDEGAVIDRAIEFGTLVSRTRVGEPAAQFYGYVADGLYQNAEQLQNAANNDDSPWALDTQIDETQGAWIGDVRFRDLNNDGDLDQEDRTFIGNPTPDFTYGITNRFNYKGIDLSVFLNGAYGNEIFNQLRRETSNPTSNQGMLEDVFNYARIGRVDEEGPDVLDNLELENPGTDIPRITDNDANDNYRVSSLFVEDGSYLRIQNVTLGYTLPSDLAQRVNLRQLRVYGTVTNLYTFTAYSGFDPEVGGVMSSAADSRTDPLLRGVDTGRYPTPRTFTLGVNIGL